MSNKDNVADVMADMINNFQNSSPSRIRDNENPTFLDMTSKSLQQDLEDPKSPTVDVDDRKTSSSKGGVMQKIKFIFIIVVVVSVIMFVVYFVFKRYKQKQQENIAKLKEQVQNRSVSQMIQKPQNSQKLSQPQSNIKKDALVQKANELATQLEEEDQIDDLETNTLITKQTTNDVKPVETVSNQQTQRQTVLEPIQESDSETESSNGYGVGELIVESENKEQTKEVEETQVDEIEDNNQASDNQEDKDEFEITI